MKRRSGEKRRTNAPAHFIHFGDHTPHTRTSKSNTRKPYTSTRHARTAKQTLQLESGPRLVQTGRQTGREREKSKTSLPRPVSLAAGPACSGATACAACHPWRRARNSRPRCASRGRGSAKSETERNNSFEGRELPVGSMRLSVRSARAL